MSLRLIAAVVLMSFLSACAAMPPMDFTPSDVLPTGKKIEAGVKDISISFAKPSESLGQIQVGFGGNQYESSFKSTFEDSLQEALIKSAVFDDYARKKVLVVAKVMQLETPNVGVNFNTDMIVKYDLLDTNTGKILFTRNISSASSVKATYAFSGQTRYTEARNRAVRSNIESFIASLSEARI